MRKLIVLAMTAALMSPLTVAAGAAGATAKTGTHHAAMKHASGELVSTTATTIVVKEKSKDVTFTTDDKTKYRVHGKFAKAEDLKAGDTVTVKYTADGETLTAHEISATAPKAAASGTGSAAPKSAPAPAPKKQ